MFPRVLAQIVRGFAMGSADIVPGVSGGTVALVLGIYNDLIGNIRTGAKALGSFVKGDFSGGVDKLKSVDWLFLIPLAVGVVLALGVLTTVIESLLESNPVEMAGLFFGLIIASIVVAWRLVGSKDGARIGLAVAVGLIMFALLGLRDISTEPGQVLVEATTGSTTTGFERVHFEPDTADFAERSDETLDAMAESLVGSPADELVISGRIDANDEVEDSEADALSLERAEAVSAALSDRGVEVGVATVQSTEPDTGAPTWAFFGAGALAICAMILPGISGSLILVLLAMYQPVLAAAHDRDIAKLLVFLVGATVGLALFSQLLSWLLEHHHDTVLAVLIGLMIGSLRILWPWPQGIEGTELGAPGNPFVVPVLLAVGAAVAVLAISAFADRKPSSGLGHTAAPPT